MLKNSGKKLKTGSGVNQLYGSYECRIDAKGRILIPAVLKRTLEKSLSKNSRALYIKKSIFRRCMELYPLPYWDEEMNRIRQLDTMNREAMDFLRKYMAGFREVELDHIGRLQIPREHVLFCGMSKDVVITGFSNKVELWAKEEYEKTTSDPSLDYDAMYKNLFINPSMEEKRND